MARSPLFDEAGTLAGDFLHILDHLREWDEGEDQRAIGTPFVG